MSRATSYNAIAATIEAGERLTVAQGRSLLSYAKMQEERAEKFAKRLDEARSKNGEISADLEVERERLLDLINRWNELCRMLDEVLICEVYGQADGTWTASYSLDGTPQKSHGHKSVAEAFRAVLKARLGKSEP